jgi:hypothetical protein
MTYGEFMEREKRLGDLVRLDNIVYALIEEFGEAVVLEAVQEAVDITRLQRRMTSDRHRFK